MKLRTATGPTSANWWAGIAPSLLVVVALVALLLVPMFVDRRVDDLREIVENAAEPARTLVAELHYLLARETVELRGFLATGDSAYLSRYSDFVRRERDVYPDLERHAANLSPRLLSRVAELRTFSEERRNRVASGDPTADPDSSELATVLAQDLSVRVLDTAFEVELALRESTLALRQQIRGIEQVSRLIYLLLLGMTFVATVAVGTLNMHIRRLIGETNDRRAEAEAALERTKRMAEARSDLIRGFTHDVKNPLGVADGYAQLLEGGVRGSLTPQQTETVSNIRRSIRGAIQIIEELLDLSRLESGGLQIEREPVYCLELAQDVAGYHAGAAAAVGIELSVGGWGGKDDESTVYSDPARIRQILDNLVSNAIKYTPPPGRIVISVQPQTLEEPPRAGNWLAIAVSDTGPGIPTEELDRIFHEFHRVPGSRGQGHGLGLAISRRVARLLGGDVTVRSTFGEGSTFLLWLPVREGNADGGAVGSSGT
jgi:signal transduction histidine kinase